VIADEHLTRTNIGNWRFNNPEIAFLNPARRPARQGNLNIFGSHDLSTYEIRKLLSFGCRAKGSVDIEPLFATYELASAVYFGFPVCWLKAARLDLASVIYAPSASSRYQNL
jgi:hypothetical protein